MKNPNKDSIVTQIAFVKWIDGEVVAVMVREYDYRNGEYTCYSHYGQHSTCEKDWVLEQSKAKPEEYAKLLKELESRDYNIEVIAFEDIEKYMALADDYIYEMYTVDADGHMNISRLDIRDERETLDEVMDFVESLEHEHYIVVRYDSDGLGFIQETVEVVEFSPSLEGHINEGDIKEPDIRDIIQSVQ